MNVPKVDSNLDAILDTLEASAMELLSVAKPWEVNRKEAALWVTLDRSLRLSEPWFPPFSDIGSQPLGFCDPILFLCLLGELYFGRRGGQEKKETKETK